MTGMTEIERYVRNANPVPDLDGLDADELARAVAAAATLRTAVLRAHTPAQTVPTQKEAPMATAPTTRIETPTPAVPRSWWRGPRIAFATAIAVLVVLGAGALGWWLGSEDTSDETSAATHEMLDAMQRAFVDGDRTAATALYAADGSLHYWGPDGPTTFQGTFSLNAAHVNLFGYVDYTEFELRTVREQGSVVFAEWDASGESGTLGRTTKTPFATRVFMVFEIDEDGLIANAGFYAPQDQLWN